MPSNAPRQKIVVDRLVGSLQHTDRGVYQADGSILADEIGEEDDDFESEIDHISLQGIIANFSNVTGLHFTIGRQPVDASITELSPINLVLGNGVSVEVKGSIVSSDLFADEVKLR